MLIFGRMYVLILTYDIYLYFRSRSAKTTDRRVRVMSEIVTGIRVIKMYAWEYAIKKYVQRIRK